MVENDVSQPLPQFSTNLFAGPCFGDLTSSQSSGASLDASSPRPLIVSSCAHSDPTEAPSIEDLMDSTTEVHKNSSFTMSPFGTISGVHQVLDPELASRNSPAMDCNESPKFIMTDPPSSPLIPDAMSCEEDVLKNPDQRQESSELRLPNPLSSPLLTPKMESNRLDEVMFVNLSHAQQSSNLPPFVSISEPDSNSADLSDADQTTLDVTSANSFLFEAAQADAMLEYRPLSALSVEFESNATVDVSFHSVSSAISEPDSSAIRTLVTVPIDPSSQSLSVPLSPCSEPSSQLIQEPDPEHSISDLNPIAPISSRPIPQFEDSVDLATFLSSSPSCLSSEPIFSSSPPLALDSSVVSDDLHSKEYGLHTLLSDENIDLSSSEHDNSLVLLNQDDFNELPPSSSPVRSSSPLPSIEDQEVIPKTEPEIENVELEELPKQEDILSKSQQVVPEPPATADTKSDLQTSHKRKRDEEDIIAKQEPELRDQLIAQAPQPKRPTLASQERQRKKLSKPFRPLTIKTPKPPAPVHSPAPPKEPGPVAKPINPDLIKHRTQRAAAQFKSPLSLAASSALPTSVRQTPTIQALERRLQVLKRAVKLKRDGEEDVLQALVKKWTEAGREVAYDVWGLVKDNDSGAGDDWGKVSGYSACSKRRFQDSWGWGEESETKRVKVEDTERNWGWNIAPPTEEEAPAERRAITEEEEEVKPRETLGTMLSCLGIEPSTLGWDEEEGEFVDADE